MVSVETVTSEAQPVREGSIGTDPSCHTSESRACPVCGAAINHPCCVAPGSAGGIAMVGIAHAGRLASTR
jgi:hypothetical protein